MAQMKIQIRIPRWRMRVVGAICWAVKVLAWSRLVRVTRRDVAQLSDALTTFVVRGVTIGKRRRKLV